ncbi:MAG TPA: hypothetical protein VKU39_01030, partial [Streptosporangiaceae bacterium]|nr:hypothetical protein [Streptosporangiaceae bacterium]
PYSPDGASLPAVTPSSAALVTASQQQYGTRPLPLTSYLQDQTKNQALANWLISEFGQIRRRIKTLTVEAASQPLAWGIVQGLNPGDLITVYDAPIGQAATTGTYRVSMTDRAVSYGANGQPVTARVTIAADPVPSSYWT